MKQQIQKNDLEDYPVSALWYTLAASFSLGVAGVALAIAWGHSVGNAILHAHM